MKNEIAIPWSKVAVLGAAGKMGKGIALLLLCEMAFVPSSILMLQDLKQSAFYDLRRYLREHLLKHLEKNIEAVRAFYADRQDLVSNKEMIDTLLQDAIDRVFCTRSIADLNGASMVFEAIIEDVNEKLQILKDVFDVTKGQAYFFTNTSSIPIGFLQRESTIGNRLIGYHFYNPPAVQKLLEIIIPKGTDPTLCSLAFHLAKVWKKTVVESEDVAGFIGNGHFIREIAFACHMAMELCKEMPLEKAVKLINCVTKEALVRPMGIFELIRYVGIDVCCHIAKVMSRFLPSEAHLFDAMVKNLKIIGQVDLTVVDRASCDLNWKSASKMVQEERNEKLKLHFSSLKGQEAAIAQQFLEQSLQIAKGLVDSKVAKALSDVSLVLMHGFYHLYGVAEFSLKERIGNA